MAEQNQGSGDQGQQEGDGRAPDNQPVMGEFAPFVDDPSLPSADTDLIMSTLFGGGADQDQSAQGAQGSGGDQSRQGGNAQSGGQPAGGQPGGSARPSGGSEGQGQGQQGQGQGSQAAQGAGAAAEELPPFSGAGNQQQASGAQQQSQSQPQGGQPSGQASASGAAADDGLSPEARLRLHTLETTNAALTQQVQQLLQQRQPAQQGSQGAGTQPGQQSGGGGQDGGNVDPAQQAINLTVPPDLAQGLVDGEGNVSLPHLQHFASAIATIAYQRAVQATTQLIDNRITQYSSSQQQETEGERLAATYYGRFKDHNREIFHPLVADESRQMLASNPQLVWNEDAINALGARVNAKLQGLGFQVGMQQQQGSGNDQGGQGQGQDGQQQQNQERGPVTFGNGGQGNAQQGNGAARPVVMLDSGTRPPPDRQAAAGDFIKATLG